MKKYLIFSIILLVSIFVFNNNVKASNIEHIEYIDPYNNQKFEYDLDLDLYPYYYLTINHHDNYKNKTYFVLHYSTEEFYFNSNFKYSNNIDNNWAFLPKNNVPIYIYSNSYSDINNYNTKIINNCYQSYCEWKSPNYNYINLNSDNVLSFLDGITTSINTPTNGIVALINYNVYDVNGNLKYNKDYFNNNNGYDSIPEITITKENEEEITLNNGISVILNNSLKINFSNFDKNKYKYLYSLDTQNWNEIEENNLNLIITKNRTIYVKVNDINDNYITSSTFTITGISENILDYSIEEGTEQGKKLIIYYYNFDITDYHIVSNFQTGKEEKFESNINGTIIYDNLNLDSTYTINSYDKNNNLLKREIIDIQLEEAKLNKNRYILVNILKERKSIFFGYGNLKENDKCFYKISNEEEIEVKCDDSYEIDINKNGYIEIYIKNNNEIVLKRGFNLNFIKNLPTFKFESYYNNTESKQVLKIIIDNLKSNDKIYYSFDKENWIQLENKRINYLDFYSSSEIYFKIERENNIVSEAYFDLVFKAFENSSDNNDKEKYNGLNGLLKYFKDITNNITNLPIKMGQNVYLLIRKSKIGLYILLIIVSSIIILFIKSIKR